MNLTPMTELDAVNLMLAVIGEAPINSLQVTGLSDAVIAHQTLTEVSREVQEKGWGFNTEDDYVLPLTVEGFINIPANVLRIDAEEDEQINVVQRGQRVYDKDNKTFVFSRAIKFQIVWMLDYEELPQAARYYIAIRAARKFQKRVVSSDLLERFSADDELTALASLQDMDTDVEDYNFFNNRDCLKILAR